MDKARKWYPQNCFVFKYFGQNHDCCTLWKFFLKICTGWLVTGSQNLRFFGPNVTNWTRKQFQEAISHYWRPQLICFFLCDRIWNKYLIFSENSAPKIFRLSRNHGLKSQQNKNLADLRGRFLARPSLPHGYFWIFVESLVDTSTLQKKFHVAVKA